MKKLQSLVLFCAALAQAHAIPQKATVNDLDKAKKQAIDKLVDAFMSAGQTPGVEVAILRKEKLVFECGYGTSEKGQSVIPGPFTHFQIDSLTKVFTAMDVIMLSEEGKLNIDKPIGNYVTLPNQAWDKIPIRDYLGMTAGLWDGGTTGSYQTVLDQVANKTGGYAKGLQYQPGSHYLYSNPGYFCLGELIEKLAPSHSFGTYSKNHILAKLGMNETGMISFQSGSAWATPYINGSAQSPRDPQAGFSGGGFVSTMHDLERFGNAIAARELISTVDFDDMWRPTKFTTGSNAGKSGPMGMGWSIQLDKKGDLDNAAKNGGGWGWGSQLTYFAKTGDCVIVLRNSSGAGAMAALNVSVEKVLTGG